MSEKEPRLEATKNKTTPPVDHMNSKERVRSDAFKAFADEMAISLLTRKPSEPAKPKIDTKDPYGSAKPKIDPTNPYGPAKPKIDPTNPYGPANKITELPPRPANPTLDKEDPYGPANK
ncbi:MAG: hypothetical protein WC651_03485 [Candidatus Gracilibacteria bacterium]|jgi:hypothetical protein